MAAAIVTFTGFNGTAAAEGTDESDGSVADLIRNRIMVRNDGKGFICRGEPICGIELLPLFYIERDYRPAWLDENGLHPLGKRPGGRHPGILP